ncbi:aminotransferase class I/II-fold pyridoxal phosphate-dependent enzyme [Sphingomonas sp. NIBR02145]|uniref:aminotransferase class I/II-fold pyridoxal phosphate-dependent enzyme n=1 Tax=Sphingomonas sp. NIBR02145 TaxID=3014784 RepID=UPI0022B43601|nr:aminotransferase class I/II-fold pyridoxal phosphate-dependent enzyme [Sphingomonas sp. NIBR02145]WHU02102.1 aminotransferase class I/II-fold pyridoxal phosphate-dependent enzyme [Sphingomonas sp. NIBR02145]
MSASWTWHGGGVEAARAHFDGEDWIDLSTGINPHPWPGTNALAIDWQRLPERHELAGLEAAAADYFGVDPRHVCAVPGTEIGLRLAGGLVGGSAHYVAPTYRTHGEMIAGAIRTTLDAAGAGTVILANPNNPDGRALSSAQLRGLLDRRDPGAWLLLDEAFADVDPALSLAGAIDDARPLMIFRSFGKFFGLAGVRLGFVLGPSPMLDAIRAALGAWPVSAAAIAIGTAAYRDRSWTEAMRARLRNDAAALDAVLAAAGHAAIGACPLFRLIEVPSGIALFEQLARHAILTRPFAEQPRWLRIGLPSTGEALARLETALRG